MIEYEELKKIIKIVLKEPCKKKSDRFIESLCLSLHRKIKGFDREDIIAGLNLYSVKKSLLRNQFPQSTIHKAISNLNKKRLLSIEYLSAQKETLSQDEKPDIVKKCLQLVYSGDSKKMEGVNIGE
jgi:hypothetical protein